MAFQSLVNQFSGFGVQGEIFLSSPNRTDPYIVNSAGNGLLNVIGATAMFVTSQGGQGQPAVCRAGSLGSLSFPFAGILANPKVYASGGAGGNPLAPNMILPDHTQAELMIMGEMTVALPGPANIGDLVLFDIFTGALSTVGAVTTFAGSIASGTPDVLTVTVNPFGGAIAVGQLISGAGIAPGTYIVSNGTGRGGIGTYNLSSTGQTVGTETMTAPTLPPAAASFTASIVSNGTMTVTAVGSGEITLGQVLSGSGVTPGTVVTAYGSGTGGTGTYATTPIGQTVTSTTITSDQTAFVPRAVVTRYDITGLGGLNGPGLGVIRLTN